MKLKTVRICDLRGWPPETGHAYGPGDVLRAASNEAIVSKLHGVDVRRVDFECSFAGKNHSYDFVTDTEDIAKQLGDIIGENVGKSLLEIGLIQIEIREENLSVP